LTQSEGGENKQYVAISRRAILEAFVKRMFSQSNINKICTLKNSDYMIVPVEKFPDWYHDMGVVLGKAIQDVVDS